MSPDTRAVHDWHNSFLSGRKSVKNKSDVRRPRTSTSEDKIHAIRDMTEGDRKRTVWKVAAEARILYGRAHF